jgi:transposase InsO family protein
MCRVLGVARSAFNDWARGKRGPRAVEDARLEVHVKAIHRRSNGTYGGPRVQRELVAEGFLVGVNRVARLMRELDLSGTPKRKFKGATTVTKDGDQFADNLLDRNFVAEGPNLAWVGDITYLPTRRGWVYLAVLIDLFSRKVVGWSLESHMQTELCLDALSSALAARAPARGLVHHTDRGSQYTSGAYDPPPICRTTC